MPMWLRAIGLLYAAGIGLGLYLLWPEAQRLLATTWLADLWLPALLVYALGGMWIAERIWIMIVARLNNRLS